MSKKTTAMETEEIMALIPHRYPMLLIDRIIDIAPGKGGTGVKCVTINEPFFQGHFPGLPVMPGVLIVEAMAQTAAAVFLKGLEDQADDKVVYFMTINEAKFRKPVKPGDVLHLKVNLEQQRGPVCRFSGRAEVDGKIVSEATFSAMMADK